MKNCEPALPAGSEPVLAHASVPTGYGLVSVGISAGTVYPGPPAVVWSGLPVWHDEVLGDPIDRQTVVEALRREVVEVVRGDRVLLRVQVGLDRAARRLDGRGVGLVRVELAGRGAQLRRRGGLRLGGRDVGAPVGRALAVAAVRDAEDHADDDHGDEEDREVPRRLPPAAALRELLLVGTPLLAVLLLTFSLVGLGHGAGVYGRSPSAWTRHRRSAHQTMAGSRGCAGTIVGREPRSAEVRGHVGGRSRPHQGGGRSHRRDPPQRRRRGRRRLGDGQDHRRPRAPRPRGVVGSRGPRDGHAPDVGGANLDRVALHGDHRSR